MSMRASCDEYTSVTTIALANNSLRRKVKPVNNARQNMAQVPESTPSDVSEAIIPDGYTFGTDH